MTKKVLERDWRFIDTGASNAFTNMSIDEAMLQAHEEGLTPPTLRVYEWSPAALSVGFFQNIAEDIDEQKCRQKGVDIVRRKTGGRSVLHKDELTYSVVASGRCGFPYSVSGSYKAISEGLIAAYRKIGMEVYLAPHREDPVAAACFNAASFGDLTCQGLKIAGSAQFRRKEYLLQHGSLPISLDTKLLFSLLKFPSETSREKGIAAFNRRATSITKILGREISRKELKEALFEGFQEALGIKFLEDALSPYEVSSSQTLVREKYPDPTLMEAG